MYILLIGLITSYPIELLGFTNDHAKLQVNTDETFSLALISNGDLENREDWKPRVTYRPKRLSEDGSVMYVEVPKNISPKKYYAYRLETRSGIFFTKAFFKDEEDGYVMTSEFEEEPRKIRKDKKNDKKNDKDKDKDSDKDSDKDGDENDKKFNDVIINISILLFIVILVMIIVSFSMCSL